MIWMITKTHQFLVRTVVAISILTLALSVSLLVQQLDGNIRSEHLSFLYLPPIGLVIILGFLSIPRLNDLVVAPNMVSHVPTQVSVSLCGAVLITWTGLAAFHAPIVTWLSPTYIAPVLAVGSGALYLILGIVGSFRAICPMPDTKTADSMKTLRKVHFSARAFAAIFGFIVSGINLGSVAILKTSSTPFTMYCSLILFVLAAVLGSIRLSVANFEKPIKLWNIALQFCVVVIAIFIIKLITRAFVFHTHLFGSFADILPIYPRFENLLMLPFIVFGLTSVALASTHLKQAKIDGAEVFA